MQFAMLIVHTKNKSKKRQVSVSLTDDEKVVLGKQSFKQNRSVSQIIRFAVKKYLNGRVLHTDQSIKSNQRKNSLQSSAASISQNADILNSLAINLNAFGWTGASIAFKLYFR